MVLFGEKGRPPFESLRFPSLSCASAAEVILTASSEIVARDRQTHYLQVPQSAVDVNR